MESDFVQLSKDKIDIQLKEIDKERRILLGAVLIPDKPVLRNDGSEDFYIFFSANTIQQVAEAYAMAGNHSRSTIEHQIAVSGATVTEMWIKAGMENDKSNLYGFNDPVGTWYAMMKISDDKIWNDFVKTGRVNGYSIEGFFSRKEVERLSQKPANHPDEVLQKIEKLLETF